VRWCACSTATVAASSASAAGDGPVDAAFKAIEAATGVAVVLRKFEVHAVSEGEDAQGEARVYVEYNHKSYRGAKREHPISSSPVRGRSSK